MTETKYPALRKALKKLAEWYDETDTRNATTDGWVASATAELDALERRVEELEAFDIRELERRARINSDHLDFCTTLTDNGEEIVEVSGHFLRTPLAKLPPSGHRFGSLAEALRALGDKPNGD